MESEIRRVNGRLWQPGENGNPNGRPVQDGTRACPSVAHGASAVMRPGSFRGEPFDDFFQGLTPSHLTFVDHGRCGINLRAPYRGFSFAWAALSDVYCAASGLPATGLNKQYE